MRTEVQTAIEFLRIAERGWFMFRKSQAQITCGVVASFLEDALIRDKVMGGAVLGGSACHSAEHAVPETTTKGEQDA